MIKMKEEPRIYVAGPYTHIDEQTQDIFIMRAEAIGKLIAKNNIKVYVPHIATGYWDDINSYKYFIDLHISILKDWATDLYLLQDWKTSNGAILEYYTALEEVKKIWFPNELERMIKTYNDDKVIF